MAIKARHFLSRRDLERGPFREEGDEDYSGEHWRLRRDDQDVAWLLFDQQGSAVNVLKTAALKELDEVLAQLESQRPRGLVIRSAKEKGFCVGADIGEFRKLEDEEAVVAALEEAHAVADRLAQLPCTSVALIHGSCLGGGLEIALCCDYRLAVPDARIGFPEIKLGLHPGLAGTVRLTRLIDPLEAMRLMLTGKSLRAQKALKLGLVDEVVEERHAAAAVRAAVSGELSPHESGLKERLLTTRVARQLEARQMRSKTEQKVRFDHYPAPPALIELWEEEGGDFEPMRAAEIRSFARLLRTDTAQNLIRVFFLREGLKKELPEASAPWVHVVGAGTMGGDIAAWCAFSGLRVSLFDPDAEALASAVKNAAELCERKHLGEAQTRAVLDRLLPDFAGEGVGRADLIIEAVPEEVELKKKIYAELEPRMKEGAVLATNTSSLPLEALAEGLDRPERLVGLHFFNPVARMQLVEVVRHGAMSHETQQSALGFLRAIDRLPVPVKSAPGFLVNRVLTPYLLEAMVLLDEGLAPESIDRAALDFGMPVGPVELADRVGLDICLHVAEVLREGLDAPMAEVPDEVAKKVEDGDLGRKSGRGLYRWKDGDPRKSDDVDAPPEETADRLLLPLLNACMACLREGIVVNEELLDGALIFGTGFAPFRGGPMHYARNRGFDDIRARLEDFAERFGKRFSPDPGWSAEEEDSGG